MNEGRNKLKKRLGPGAWIDQDDNLHFSVPEILNHLGVADTPENRDQLMHHMAQWVKQQVPQAEIEQRTGCCPACGGMVQVTSSQTGPEFRCLCCAWKGMESQLKQ